MKHFADRLIENGVTIFLLHGVEDGVQTQVRNYTGKHIPKPDFTRLLAELTRCGTPVSMDDVVANREDGRSLPPFAFAITFDDGFENNLTEAAPVLADFGVPATYYVTTDFIDSNRMSWIDRVEFAVEATPAGHLRLPWGECKFSDVESKKAFLNDVRGNVKSSSDLIPDDVASEIQVQLGVGEVWSSDHALDQKMTWAQVQELSEMPGTIIGGHTHTHPIMSFLDEQTLEREISVCLELLRDKAGLDCRHFSYPEGLAHCYNEQVISALKRHGIVCSPSAIDGVNPPEVDLFHLFRVMVG